MNEKKNVRVTAHSDTTFTTYILHELATNWPNLFAQCCTEHHHLLLMGCDLKDFLDVTSHVCCKQKDTERAVEVTLHV